jgi:hypothetical protein
MTHPISRRREFRVALVSCKPSHHRKDHRLSEDDNWKNWLPVAAGTYCEIVFVVTINDVSIFVQTAKSDEALKLVMQRLQ